MLLGAAVVALGSVAVWAVLGPGAPRSSSSSDDEEGPHTTVAHVASDDCRRDADEYRPELEVVVDAEPTTGLEDGSTISAATDCLGAGASLSVVTCRAGLEWWYDRCDRGAGSQYTVPESGRIEVDVTVSRVLTPPAGQAVDCAAETGACTLMIVSFEDEWGEVPLSFRSGLPEVPVERRGGDVFRFRGGEATPAGAVAVGDEVTLDVTGFEPGEELIVGLCTDGALEDGLLQSCRSLTTGLYDIDDEATQLPPVTDADGRASFTTEVAGSVRPTMARFTDEGDDSGADCTARAGRCLLVVAAAIDLQRLAVFPLEVSPR